MKKYTKILFFIIFISILLIHNSYADIIKPVFYSISPYGMGDVKNGSPTITISGGVATLSVAQTGNIGVGCNIDFDSPSVNVYIAPNRVRFDSGGTVELKVGDKIEENGGDASGVVRAIKLTSGTWAGGDAAGHIYFSETSGTWTNNGQIDRVKPSSSSNIATVDGTLEGNIGSGNTQFVVKDADGDDASDVGTSETVNSIHHEYASLADFDAGFTDVNHIGDPNLVLKKVVAYACCYYDHIDDTADIPVSTIYINWSGTTSSTYYLEIFTPTGNSESINMQRHNGTYSSNAYRIEKANTNIIFFQEDHIRLIGLQLYVTGTNGVEYNLRLNTGNASVNTYWIVDNIFRGDPNSTDSYEVGIYIYNTGGSGSKTYISNNILYNITSTTNSNYVTAIRDEEGDMDVYFYNNTIHNCGYALVAIGSSRIDAKNNVINDCDYDEFEGTFDTNTEYNVLDTTGAVGAVGATHESGKTTDGTEANKLVDSSETFPNVQVGSIVKNTTDTTYSYVTSIAEAGSGKLGINDDVFVSGEGYTIYTNIYGSIVFENEAGDDFHLDSSDTIAIDKGTDLSSDTYLPMWDDIDGDERGATWDVGADEYIAPISGILIPYYYLNNSY